MADAWASVDGLAIPGVCPSLFVAESRITALMGSPFLTASSRRFEITAFSALMYPLALTSKVWHLPENECTPFTEPPRRYQLSQI